MQLPDPVSRSCIRHRPHARGLLADNLPGYILEIRLIRHRAMWRELIDEGRELLSHMAGDIVRAQTRPSRSVRGCLIGLLAGVVDGCGVQLHPALFISAVSKSVSRVLASWLLAGTGTRLLLHPGEGLTLVSGNILLVSCF
jgi:hypothetical protein